MFLRWVVLVFLVLLPVDVAVAIDLTPAGVGLGDVFFQGGNSSGTKDSGNAGGQVDGTEEPGGVGEEASEVVDPLEPFNRVMFVANDLVYSVVIKPLALIYTAVTPEIFRTAIRNFFHNLAMPTHLLNAVLQQKPELAGRELYRFVINTTVGVLGFYDAASDVFKINPGNEDVGQTLGVYGIGDAVFLNLPIIGPSNVRDTIGRVGDAFLNPLSYTPSDIWARFGIQGARHVNETSLSMDDYENLKKAALDPYIAVRDAYTQTRRKQIKE